MALVIGNSQYESGPLKNPSNDADAISDALRSLGFAVTKKKDVTRDQFEDAVDQLTSNLQTGDACLIFYAGHGIQMEQQNYLIPVGATLDRPQHVKRHCVSISYLLDALNASGCSLKVVVVDACRNNPFRSFNRSSSGLARLENAPEGTIVSFSTSPKTPALDGLGDNSPFARHLVAAMEARAGKVEIVSLFREASRAVKRETGQIPYLEFDATMPNYFLMPGPRMEIPVPELISGAGLGNSIGMQLTLVPEGEFDMGSGISADAVARRFRKYDEKTSRYKDEHPQLRVRITKHFYMGDFEVTRGQFRQFVDATGYKTECESDGEGGWGFNEKTRKVEGRSPRFNWKKTGLRQSDSHPVVNVTWNDAVAFCSWLSIEEHDQYRLPTEAKWEYACRAGSTTMYANGDNEELPEHIGNVFDASALKVYAPAEANSPHDRFAFTAPVGQFPKNDFELFDMHGNVWEWCSDWYGEDYYPSSPRVDPQGPSSGTKRVLRGGSWYNLSYNGRSARRHKNPPSSRRTFMGFRVVCEAE